MATKKLDKNTYPAGTLETDFKCHGPVAIKDTEFEGCRMADMGCFQQEKKGVSKDGDARVIDSNKFYHAAVVNNNNDWYLYIEFGRVGKTSTFQFTPCNSEDEAKAAFVKQCKSKNTSRGVWDEVGGIEMFVPKTDSKGKLKDLYSVQRLASRDFGLPDARNVSNEETVSAKKIIKKISKKNNRCDPQTTKLMRDLIGGTVSYTRTTIQGGTTPTQDALNEGRDILNAAMSRLGKVGDNIEDQVQDSELKQLTYALYGRIPKIKPIGASEKTWILSKDNIFNWEQDINAFESALNSGDYEINDEYDPMDGMPVDMEWIDPKTDLGKYIIHWSSKSTRNRHSYLGNLKIHNVWKVSRHGDDNRFLNEMSNVEKTIGKIGERPFCSDKKRFDLNVKDRKRWWNTNTNLLFHATRSVNVSGILRTHFRIPSQLSNVVITGAMFGAFGTYLASDWKKSAGYSSLRGSYWSGGSGAVKGRNAFMFVCDSILGESFIAPGPRGYTKPPNGCNSVWGKAEHSGVANDEYVVVPKQIQQKYLLEFSA